MGRKQEFEAGRSGLTDDDRRMIDFERANPASQGGVKENRINETFGKTPTQYYQHINRLAQNPEAHKYDATTMKRVARVANKKLEPRGPQAWGM